MISVLKTIKHGKKKLEEGERGTTEQGTPLPLSIPYNREGDQASPQVQTPQTGSGCLEPSYHRCQGQPEPQPEGTACLLATAAQAGEQA